MEGKKRCVEEKEGYESPMKGCGRRCGKGNEKKGKDVWMCEKAYVKEGKMWKRRSKGVQKGVWKRCDSGVARMRKDSGKGSGMEVCGRVVFKGCGREGRKGRGLWKRMEKRKKKCERENRL